jgi:hypothetical protein
MTRSKINIFLLLLFFCTVSLAQKKREIDSLRTKLSKDSAHIYRYQKIRPVLRIDNRDSYIKNKFGSKNVPLYVNGIQLDVIYKVRHTIGVCGYTITNSSKFRELKDNSGTLTYQDLDLAYGTFYYQYAIISHRFFEVDLPLEVGLGKYHYYLKDDNKNPIPGHQEYDFMKLAGAGIKVILKPLRWVGLSVSGGYRLTWVAKNSDMDMNSFYSTFGIWVDLRQIIRDSRYYLIKRPKYRKQIRQLQLQG